MDRELEPLAAGHGVRFPETLFDAGYAKEKPF
jgi:hypothetical protein